MPLGNPYTDVGNAQKAGFQLPRVKRPPGTIMPKANFNGFAGQRADMTEQMRQQGGMMTPELAGQYQGMIRGNQEMYNEDGSLKEPQLQQPQPQMPQEPLPFMLPGQAGVQRRTNPLFYQK